MKYVLCYGNVVDSFAFIGPFDSAEEATDYALSDREIRHDSWHVILLQTPAIEG